MARDRAASSFLHPASGALILALDWLLFSGSVFSLGLGTMALASIGFVTGTIAVVFTQYRYGHDPMMTSGLKGLLAGVLVGLPLPIAGTAVGGLILSLSGLDRWRNRLGAGSDSDRNGTPDRPPDSYSAGRTTRSSS